MTVTLTLHFKTEPDPQTLATVIGVSKMDTAYVDHHMTTDAEDAEQ